MTVAPTHPAPAAPGLPRAVVVLLGLSAVVIVVAGLRSAATIVGPVFLALVLTIATRPLHSWLSRRLPDWLGTLICVVVVNVALVLLTITLILATARFATLLLDYESQFDDLIDDLTSSLRDLGIASGALDDLTSSFDLSRVTGLVTTALGAALGVVSGLAFLVALLFFMTVDGSQFSRHLRATALLRPELIAALATFASSTRRYLAVSTTFGLIVAVLDTTALWLLDVPAPLLWGLLAFFTNYIPNIGFVIGLVPPAVLALLDGGPGLMLAVVAVYCVLNVVIQSIIQPKVVGDAVGLSTTLTFLSLVFWSWVIGPLGAVLAVPLSLLVRAVLVDADPGSRWLTPLVANTVTPADHGPDTDLT